jgi:hypothetical protein
MRRPHRPAAGTQFDGTYAFISAAKVNETYRDFDNREHQCGNPRAGPLTVVNGEARFKGHGGRFKGSGGREFEGTVGPRGELAMRSVATSANKSALLPSTIMVTGSIDDHGTIRALWTSWYCQHDFIWQKSSR